MTCSTATTRRHARKLPATPIIAAVQSLFPDLSDAIAVEKALEDESLKSPGFQDLLERSQERWDEVLDQLQKIVTLPLTYPEEAPLQLAVDLVRQTLELQEIADESVRARFRTQLQIMSQAPFGCSIKNRRVAMFARDTIKRLLDTRGQIDALMFGSGFAVSLRRQAA